MKLKKFNKTNYFQFGKGWKELKGKIKWKAKNCSCQNYPTNFG